MTQKKIYSEAKENVAETLCHSIEKEWNSFVEEIIQKLSKNVFLTT